MCNLCWQNKNAPFRYVIYRQSSFMTRKRKLDYLSSPEGKIDYILSTASNIMYKSLTPKRNKTRETLP